MHRNPDGSFFVTCYGDVAEVLNDRAMSSDRKIPLSGVFGPDAPIYEHHANSAVEEMLRYDSPNQIGGRLALEEITIRDSTIPANTFVWVSNGAGQP